MTLPRPLLCTLLLLAGCSESAVPTATGDDDSSSGEPTTGSSSLPPSTTGAGNESTSSTGLPDTEDGTSGGDGSSSSAGASVCGDGVVEGTETCDDGNTEDGDACRFDCRIAFEVLGTSSFHSGTEGVFEVVVDDDGVAWMAGGVRGQGTLTVAPLVLAYAPDSGFMPAWHPALAEEHTLSAIALHPTGDILVTGALTVGEEQDGTLARFDFPDPPLDPGIAPVWSLTHDGPDEGSEIANRDYAHDVAVNDEGQVYAAYSSREPDEGTDIRISKYDADGAELWSWLYTGAGHDDDFPRKLALAPNGDVVFGGLSSEAPGSEGGILGRLSPEGEPLAIETALPDQVFALDVDADGVTAGGIRWIQRRTPTLDDVVFTDTTPGFDVIYGIRAFEGGVAAAGGIGVVGEQFNVFVAAWTTQGDPIWTDTYGHESGLNDVGRDLAFGPDGTLFVVGFEEVIGEDDNVFVRRYAFP
ncbi:MAG: DUF4215 domain-containing protein [Nannocystales bacterium]